MTEALRAFYADAGPERVGFVLTDGTVVEVRNAAPNPDAAFDVAAEDLLAYEDRLAATWHTHPGAPAQLSGADYQAFRAWPHLAHLIVGSDGVRRYAVHHGAVIEP